ncbi:MAG TPA: ROK family protein, partial [Limnochordia bacterium]|nr:ROK family protein [Limnochordia bacterium]
MIEHITKQAVPKFGPELDSEFRPAALWNRAFAQAVEESGQGVPFAVALERDGGQVSVYKTRLFPSGERPEWDGANWFYVERLVKCLLWMGGGWRLIVGGSSTLGERLREAYAPGGGRSFDAEFMGRVYERPFQVEIVEYSQVPAPYERTERVGGHLAGCRIGFDAGGSDRKVAALIDGEVVFADETVWHPKLAADPDYHFAGIMDSLTRAAAHLPRVDALGVSSAGIYINNRTMVASLFLKVPQDLFEAKVKDIYLRAAQTLGNVPVVVR